MKKTTATLATVLAALTLACAPALARDKDGWKVESYVHPVTLQHVR